MRRCVLLRAAASALAMLSAIPCMGQTVEINADHPKMWVWTPNGVPCGVTPSPSDFQTAMVKLQVGPPSNETGAQAAVRVAHYILQHNQTSAWTPINDEGNTTCHVGSSHAPDITPTSASDTRPNLVCISIQGFGQNTSNVGNWAGSPLTFFRESDRMLDYIGGSPILDDDHFGFPFSTVGRRYRHPFIENARSATAPLRVWMQDFVAKYKCLQACDAANGCAREGCPYLPDPSRFFMDIESPISDPGSLEEIFGQDLKDTANHVRMLRQIWESRLQPPGGLPNYWTVEHVPGDPGDPPGTTNPCGPGQCTAGGRDRG